MKFTATVIDAAADILNLHGVADRKAIELAINAALSARKPPKPITDWNVLLEVAQRGYDDASECLAIMDLYQLGEQSDIFLKTNSTDAAWSFKRISIAIIARLQILIVRAYGTVTREDDRHLRAAIDFLRDADLKDVHEGSDRQRLQNAIDGFEIALKDARLKRLKAMRDKNLAHAATYEFGPHSPTYTDLFEFACVTVKIWEDLAFGSGVVLRPGPESRSEAAESAKAYWRLITGHITLPYNRNP